MSDELFQEMLKLYNSMSPEFWEYSDGVIDAFFDRLFDDARGAE